MYSQGNDVFTAVQCTGQTSVLTTVLLPVSLSIEPADTNNTHTSPDWGSDWMASNMPGTCYIQLYRMKGRCVSKWNPLRFTSRLQKEQLLLLLVAFLFMQAAERLSTWMSVDSMYAEPQVTWFWQSPAVTLSLPSSARRRTEAGGGGARSTLSARQRSRRRRVVGLFTTTYILTDSIKDREHVKQNSDDKWGWEAVSFSSKKRVWWREEDTFPKDHRALWNRIYTLYVLPFTHDDDF